MPSQKPIHYAIILYPGFQALDAFGPLDTLNILAGLTPLTLSIISHSLDAVSTKHNRYKVQSPFSEAIVPTHTFAKPPEKIDVLIVPGGFGTRDEANMKPVVEFVKSASRDCMFVLSVCTGSVILAWAGVLDGKTATTNKRSWIWATSQGPSVSWIAKARWVVDGNIWTSSGVTAGMDLIFAFVEEVYGKKVAEEIGDMVEYTRVRDAGDDPFAEVWGVRDVLPVRAKL
jgi:transcriptional regulator GlxA family with amidase domain